MTKPPRAALTQVEFVNDGEIDLHDRHNHHLREPSTWFEYEFVGAPIPAGNKQLPLVIGINQPHEIAKHYAVLMAEARARQNHCCQTRILYVYCYTRRDQFGLAWLDHNRLVQTRAQVDARRAGGRMLWQRKIVSDPGIKNF